MTARALIFASLLVLGDSVAGQPTAAVSRSVTLDDGDRLPLDSEGLLVPKQLAGRSIVKWDGPLTVAESAGPIRVRLLDTPLTLDLRTVEGSKQAVVRLRAVGGEACVEIRLRSAAGKYPVRLEIQPVRADRDAEVREGGKPVRLALRPLASEIEVEPVEGAVSARVIPPADR
jgi:hypothetical protein